MRNRSQWLMIGALLMAGCSQSEPETHAEAYSISSDDGASEAAPQNKFGFREAVEPSPLIPDLSGGLEVRAIPAADAVAVEEATDDDTNIRAPGTPQIAYSYRYGFRVDNGQISTLQQKHVDLCEKKGTRVCRVIRMSRDDAEGEYGNGSLKLEVVADKARPFGSELTKSTEGTGGEQVSMSIASEDLSKQIVDTEARLRARILLRDRLMEVLRTRQGSVADLVAAERGVAEVNEEIDKAQSWLAEMKGRVSFSDMDISYNSGSRSSGGFFAPIANAATSTGSILGPVVKDSEEG